MIVSKGIYLQKVIQSMLATIEMQSPIIGLYHWTTYVLQKTQ
jgi:hypothetical protein